MSSSQVYDIPYLTSDIAGIGGKIKARYEDFIVEEIPLYPASGDGTHLYVHIEKQGMATMEAINQIAKTLGKSRMDIGYAGMKDARAVTRQWISVEHVTEENIHNLDIPRLKILDIQRHGNKLRVGHLAGNRFILKVRDFDLPLDKAQQIAQDILARLISVGVPNGFGSQRFGMRNDSHKLGKAILQNDKEEFLSIFLGRPMDGEQEEIFQARSLYDAGDYEQAIDYWPRSFPDQRRMLAAFLKGKTPAQVYGKMDKRLKKFYISAFQSEMFNRLLISRMPQINTILDGDVAYKHENGACFSVEDASAEQQRADRFEISPTGPLFGSKMKAVQSKTAELENAVLESMGLSLEDFKNLNPKLIKGGRRSLRFQIRDMDLSSGEDDMGEFIELRFVLDPGCYATSVLREITKNPNE